MTSAYKRLYLDNKMSSDQRTIVKMRVSSRQFRWKLWTSKFLILKLNVVLLLRDFLNNLTLPQFIALTFVGFGLAFLAAVGLVTVFFYIFI